MTGRWHLQSPPAAKAQPLAIDVSYRSYETDETTNWRGSPLPPSLLIILIISREKITSSFFFLLLLLLPSFLPFLPSSSSYLNLSKPNKTTRTLISSLCSPSVQRERKKKKKVPRLKKRKKGATPNYWSAYQPPKRPSVFIDSRKSLPKTTVDNCSSINFHIMSTVVTMAPSPAPHERASYNSIEVSSQHSSPPARAATTATTQSATARRESDSPKASTEGKKSSPNG